MNTLDPKGDHIAKDHLITKAPKQMVVENAKQPSGV